MKFKHLFIAAFAAVAALVSCDKEEDLGAANISVESATITLESGEASETISFTATRDWSLTCPDWIAVSAKSGKASTSKQKVTISVEENAGNDRTGDVVISIGLAKATVTVIQKGKMGAYEAEEGDGSKDKPFNVAQAADAVKDLTYTDTNTYDKVGPYYVRGKIVSIKEAFSAEYGNGNFTISDDGSANGAQFTCYRVMYLENKKWVEGNTQIQVGDVVVIYGELMNFKGNTPETVQKGSYLYSLNGETQASGGVVVDHSNDPAKTVADFISAADEKTYYKLTGKVSKFNATYCSFDLTDETGTIYVYSVDNSSDWANKITNGATVTLSGKYKYYADKSQHEVVNAVILSCEGGEPAIDPNQAPDITVAEIIAKGDETNYYKLTGTVSKFNATYCSFDLTDATGTIYVYSVKNKTDWADKISDGATVVLAGQYQLYKKEGKEDQPEIVNAIIISCEGGQGHTDSEPKGSGTLADPYNAAKAKEVASALDPGAKTEKDVYVAGKIASIKYTFSAQYGTATFDISDDGTTAVTTFSCYSVFYLNNRAWEDGDTQVAVGDDVIICGKLVNYKDEKTGNTTPETASKEAWIYSLNGQTSIDQSPVFGVEKTEINVGATATGATIKVTGNVPWTATTTAILEGGSVSGNGKGEFSVAFDPNTDTENTKEYTVTIVTTADVQNKEIVVTIIQAKSAGTGSSQVVFVVADYAASNGWENGKQYKTMEASDVTLTAVGGGNTGKFYDNGKDWRFYQNESAVLNITVSDNLQFVSVSFEYTIQNTGMLVDSTGAEVPVGAENSCQSFSVANSGTATNGQIRFTKITVTVK